MPDVLRGRVMSVYTTLFAGTTPIGGLFVGRHRGGGRRQPLALGIGGVIAVVAAAVGFVRNPDRPVLRRSAPILTQRDAQNQLEVATLTE